MRTIKFVILITLIASVARNSFSQTSVVVEPNITKGDQNVAVGYNAGDVMTGDNGVYIGANAGGLTTSGSDNVMWGSSAGHCNTLGERNIFAGFSAGFYNASGVDNIFFGYRSGRENRVGNKNIFIGGYAGYANTSGNQSVAVGYQAGYLATGSNNLFLGYQAGFNETGSNKLYIANTSTATPLLYGEFNNAQLTVYNALGIGAKPNTGATLRIYKASTPSLELESPGSKLQIGVATCNGCFAPTARIGDVVFRGLVGTQSLIFNMATTVRDSNKYIGFSTDIDHFIMKVRSDRKVQINGLLQTSELLVDGNGKVGIGTTAPDALLQIGHGTQNQNNIFRGLILDGGWTNTSARSQNLVTFKATNSVNPNPFDDISGESLKNFHIGIVTDSEYYYSGTSRFSIINGGQERFSVKANGNVGIGTETPEAKLHINNGQNSDAAILATSNEYNKLIVSSGVTTPVYVSTFKITHEFGTNRNNGYISFHRGGSYDGGFLSFGSSGIERLRIDGNGNVGIGTYTPQYELDVCGTIRAKEVKIDLNCVVPDFVFKEGYPLMDLNELKDFVQTKHHLPEIPSEKEMHENGMNMMELQLKLLQKIEELTLYTFQQEEKINALEEKLEKISRND
jgi:hypothetical protein